MATPLSPETIVYGVTVAGDPNVSPNGSRIVYSLMKTDREKHKANTHLWLSDINGDNRRQLTHGGTSNGEPRWSPDGCRIAFTSDRAGDKKRGIYVLSVDQGGDARELTTHAQGISSLAWAPDGKSIARHRLRSE